MHYLYGEIFEIFTDYKSLNYHLSEGIEYAAEKVPEFLKDYDFELQYHRKANVVADVLSKKLSRVATCLMAEWSLIEQLRDLDLGLRIEKKKIIVRGLSVQPHIIQKIKELQPTDRRLRAILKNLDSKSNFSIRANGARL